MCVYEKVRDKLGGMCAKVVMVVVCVCAHVSRCIWTAVCTHDLSQERQSSSIVGSVACF